MNELTLLKFTISFLASIKFYVKMHNSTWILWKVYTFVLVGYLKAILCFWCYLKDFCYILKKFNAKSNLLDWSINLLAKHNYILLFSKNEISDRIKKSSLKSGQGPFSNCNVIHRNKKETWKTLINKGITTEKEKWSPGCIIISLNETTLYYWTLLPRGWVTIL